MLALALKLTLAPALVAIATKVAGRLGHRAGGLVGGLPVVAGPILLIYAVEQGQAFADEAAAGAVLGIVSLVGFCLAYALAARRHGTAVALAAGWAAFGAGTAAFAMVEPPLAVSTALSLTAVAVGTFALHRMAPDTAGVESGPDLLVWRLVVTATLVIALTAAAGSLSAHLAGLLAPFPIITAVLAGFTQAHTGAGAAIELLSGLSGALVCFTVFFALLAASIDAVGVAAAFALATAGALACWAVLVAVVARVSGGA
ncbi:MAG TPA: hypothetical protein VEX39_00010 [Thermoleophilaceae bacterium]|nr:hypothetical protein [Thermoleophilaceae bacterium]